MSGSRHPFAPIEMEHPLPPPPLDIALEAADRIGPAPSGRRGGGVLVFAIAALIGVAGGMAILDDRVRGPEPVRSPPAETSSLAKPAAELPVAEVPAVPDTGIARPAEPSQSERAEAPVEESAEPPERLPPPTVDKDDPHQIKALAAGLHPGLSRVLLMRLTPEDYKNAGIAIRTALLETKDGSAHVFPKQPAAGLAQFRVHFVRGAVDCQRYVVTVSLEGWATTALPMEKCGARLVEPKPRQD